MRRRRSVTWSKREEKFILENYHIMSARELAEKLGKRTQKAVYRKLEELRKEGKIEPLDGDAVRKRRKLRRELENPDILDDGFEGANGGFEYEEV